MPHPRRPSLQIDDEISVFDMHEDSESDQEEVIRILGEQGLCWQYIGMGTSGQHYRLFVPADGSIIKVPFTPENIDGDSDQTGADSDHEGQPA